MGTALYIALDQEIPGFDSFVNGKFISEESDALDRIATKLGVTPLMDFFSTSPDEMSGFLDGEALEKIADMKLGKESWFDPEDGLRTVQTLISYFNEKSDKAENHQGVISDLREFEQVLLKAKNHGVKWHLSIDF